MGVWDFTFNGVNASDKNLIVTAIRRPILPALRSRKMVIPGKDGAWDFGGNNYEEQVIPVECVMVRPFKIQDHIRDIAHWLSQKGTIRFSDEPDKYYIGRLYTELIMGIDGSIGRFTLPFVCEPFAYADQDEYNESYQYDVDWELDTGLIYPNESQFDWLYFRQGMGLYNHSHLEADIKFTITGSVDGIKITHHESGNVLDLDVSIANGTVVIDTESYTCELADGSNLLEHLSGVSEFFKLQPGTNTFTFEGMDPNCTVEYIWNHRFI